jgi:hypothetical protein
MPQLSSDKKDRIRQFTTATVERLLQFKLIHDLTKQQIEKLRENWRAVEQELHVDYPIAQAGVIAMLAGGSVGVEGVYGEDFLITDEPVAPEDIVGLLGTFPFDAASCAFVFTMLEEYGDVLVSLVNPGFAQDRTAWHRGIYGGKKLGRGKGKEKIELAFAEPFGLEEYQISEQIILSMMLIKNERNSFAHAGRMTMPFGEFFRRAMSVICYLFLMMMPEGEILIVHHTDDFSGRFADAESFRETWIEELKKR